jgi:hypothetical protein
MILAAALGAAGALRFLAHRRKPRAHIPPASVAVERALMLVGAAAQSLRAMPPEDAATIIVGAACNALDAGMLDLTDGNEVRPSR